MSKAHDTVVELHAVYKTYRLGQHVVADLTIAGQY